MKQSRIRVKMCGMTRKEDINHAISLGVDAIGLIFYPKSPRCVSISQAQNLLENMPPFVQAVAVVANPEPNLVQQILASLPIQLIQFHGEEAVDFCQQFNKPFIKAIPAHSTEHIVQAAQEFSSAKALLLDTPSTTARGGTGLAFDWRMIPRELTKPLLLAGGINEFNLVQALRLEPVYALDLCSSIETSPGIKDHDKMSLFMHNLKEAK